MLSPLPDSTCGTPRAGVGRAEKPSLLSAPRAGGLQPSLPVGTLGGSHTNKAKGQCHPIPGL